MTQEGPTGHLPFFLPVLSNRPAFSAPAHRAGVQRLTRARWPYSKSRGVQTPRVLVSLAERMNVSSARCGARVPFLLPGRVGGQKNNPAPLLGFVTLFCGDAYDMPTVSSGEIL